MNELASPARGSFLEILTVFLRLGLTSFGGPIAHLGHFRRELIEKRRWFGEDEYAQLIGLSQFLPGPASSQLGFTLGLLRGGWPGALAAFLAFTLPSAALMYAFARFLPSMTGGTAEAAIHGLKLVALAVVAHGVQGMARRLCPDRSRQTIAAGAAAIVLLTQPAWVQLVVVAAGAVAGWIVCRNVAPVAGSGIRVGYGVRTGAALLVSFAILLVGLPIAATMANGALDVVEVFYRAGALVFGGGHVVLPLLEEAVVRPAWLSADQFLAGYGAAQAVPGPMFTFASYLGASLPGQGGLAGAALALGAIFLPGFLLIAGVLPSWRAVTARADATRAIAGLNAAVVGLLGAALYDPIWTSSVRGPVDLTIALVGWILLVAWRASALAVVVWCVAASTLAATL